MYNDAHPGFRSLGCFAPFAVNSGLRPETHKPEILARTNRHGRMQSNKYGVSN